MVPVMIPMAIMRVIIVVKVPVIAPVRVPVIRAPWIPIGRIISPVPGGMPANITGTIDKPDDWPGSNLVSGNCHWRWSCYYYGTSHVTGIGSFLTVGINGFNNVIFAVQRFVTNKLYPGCPVVEALNSENGYILCFIPVQLRS